MNFISKHYTFINVPNEMKSILFSDVQTEVPNLLLSGPPTPREGPGALPRLQSRCNEKPVLFVIQVLPECPGIPSA